MPGTLESWGALAVLEDGAAQEAMVARFHQLAGQPESERYAELRTMITEEYALNTEALQHFTANRLRSWLQLPSAEANEMANAYNTVFDSFPGELAMRRASVVQTVARMMTPDEINGLHLLIPSLVAQIPAGKPAEPPRPAEEPAEVTASTKPHPAWMFWKGRGGRV